VKASLLVLAAALLASPQTYRGRADAVTVDVLALDGNRPIGGLSVADFALSDNGVPQRIEGLAVQEVPFSMTLVLDTSSSVQGASLHDLQEAAHAAVAALRPDDQGALITFSHLMGGRPAWTSDHPPLDAAIVRAEADGMTSLYDVAFAALVHGDPELGRRRLIVLFTDGNDTSSWLPSRAALDAASRNDAVVYAVTTATPEVRRLETRMLMMRSGIRLAENGAVVESTPFLKDLVERTGGTLMVETSSNHLRQVFEHIVAEFRSRYVLNYIPSNVASTGWHTIDVQLVGRKGTVKARRGYQR